MSSSVTATQLAQSHALLLTPGIVNIFVQGIESGLVFAQFSQWFYTSDRIECSLLSSILVFVTLLGFAQSGICFVSAWSQYVQHFGVILTPDWSDYLPSIPTLFMSFPVQALMIRRCYYLVGKNLYIIAPLVLLLVAATVTSLWSTVPIIQFVLSIQRQNPNTSIENVGISWLYLVSMILPSLLDIILTGILLHYLTQTMKQVYATHTRRLISRLVNVVWQSALPPTLCTVCMCVIYVQFAVGHQVSDPHSAPVDSFEYLMDLEKWPNVIQASIGKLYVLSLFYMINSQSLGGWPQPDDQPTAFISTFTGQGSEIAAGRAPERTIEYSV
ncbi:hypothetical protein EI94DRAFT_1803656 [Lactarius quietus]|nr:hypothetical protein EI94DRAFT_1803656 [Lactarius quietus]